VSEWQPWSPCSVSCGIGESTRRRQVLKHARRGGRHCPSLAETKWCGEHTDCPQRFFNWWPSTRGFYIRNSKLSNLRSGSHIGKYFPWNTECGVKTNSNLWNFDVAVMMSRRRHFADEGRRGNAEQETTQDSNYAAWWKQRAGWTVRPNTLTISLIEYAPWVTRWQSTFVFAFVCEKMEATVVHAESGLCCLLSV
jgi:hypothetical protein